VPALAGQFKSRPDKSGRLFARIISPSE